MDMFFSTVLLKTFTGFLSSILWGFWSSTQGGFCGEMEPCAQCRWSSEFLVALDTGLPMFQDEEGCLQGLWSLAELHNQYCTKIWQLSCETTFVNQSLFFFPHVLPCVSFLWFYLPLISVAFLIMYHPPYFSFYLKYFDLRALILFRLFDLLPILGSVLSIHWNWYLPDTFQINKKSLDLK